MRCVRRTISAFVVVAALIVVAQTQVPPVQSPGVAQRAAQFTMRVDPGLADRVNAVLGRLAQMVETTVPANTSVESHLSRLCGGHAPALVERVTGGDASPSGLRLRLSPCVSIRRNVELTVEANNTLEGFAVRNGLSPKAVGELKITRGPNSDPARRITPETLMPKDRVTIPEAPQWMSITVKPDLVRDRSGFVAALAAGIGCAGQPAEACLTSRGITVLERGVPQAPVQREPTAAQPRGQTRTGTVDGFAVTVPSLEPPPPVPPIAPAVAAARAIAAPSVSFVDAIPVARDQWPYDAKLLAAILRRAHETNSLRPDPVVIGVAEGGLAARDGAPLANDVFAPPREDDPEPDDLDDDGNRYLNDLLGAGPLRASENTQVPFLGSGDVGLCGTGTPPFQSWHERSVELASHGSIVASIAIGRPVRVADAGISGRLPRIAFYRMLDDACADDATFNGSVEAENLVLAFDYLENRAQIINISYSVRPDAAKTLIAVMKTNLMSSNKLLVLPAGNDFPGNLDDSLDVCPACLGNPVIDSTVAQRTVVVGSASRELRRQAFSNSGPSTVWLYAPGEAKGAVDVRGHDATSLAAATSYSAPYASLAAALMWSLGLDDVKRVKERLDVATWPLFQDNGRSDAKQGGVLDLVKAAAVRLHAVDVRTLASDGTFERRTYVGSLLGPLNQLLLCDGKTFQQASVQALRFETSPFNDRQVRVYPRDFRDNTQHKWKNAETCRLPGGDPMLRIKTLDGTEKAFQIADVLQLQLPWVTGAF